jgi:hypothetical protein
MENTISLRPNPTILSYFKQFQVARSNFQLYQEEERLQKRKHKNKTLSTIR